jgi:hypothetical protein
MIAAARSYGACTIRARRTAAEIESIRQAIYETLLGERPMTLRQLFYQLVSQGVVAKTEGEYNRTVGRLLLEMRRSGAIPYSWIADSTRWMRRPRTYTGIQDVLEQTLNDYRRDVWQDQEAYVELWLEKDALAGVLLDVTAKWHVPLMVTKGYPSETFTFEAAQAIEAQQKPTYLYYFGDWDPSGVDIPRKVEERLRAFAPTAEIHFERVAVNPDQIAFWDLPTRPTKTTDSRSRSFSGESVEVDAIASSQLRAMATACIEWHVDAAQLARTQATEAAERDSLAQVFSKLPRGGGVQ